MSVKGTQNSTKIGLIMARLATARALNYDYLVTCYNGYVTFYKIL